MKFLKVRAFIVASSIALLLMVFITPSTHASNLSLITGPIDDSNLVVVTDTAQMIREGITDQGPVPGDTELTSVMIALKPYSDPTNTINNLQNPSSASYHQWLTPEEYASQFGISKQDIQTIIHWLQSYGLTATQTPNNVMNLLASGTVGQFDAAFHMQLDYFYSGQTKFIGIKDDIRIPAALANVLVGPLFSRPLPAPYLATQNISSRHTLIVPSSFRQMFLLGIASSPITWGVVLFFAILLVATRIQRRKTKENTPESSSKKTNY